MRFPCSRKMAAKELLIGANCEFKYYKIMARKRIQLTLTLMPLPPWYKCTCPFTSAASSSPLLLLLLLVQGRVRLVTVDPAGQCRGEDCSVRQLLGRWRPLSHRTFGTKLRIGVKL